MIQFVLLPAEKGINSCKESLIKINFDEMHSKGYAYGKDNIVPRQIVVQGDIRCLANEQIDATEVQIKAIMSSNHLLKANASISFDLKYPPMKPTAGNYKVLKVLDEVSQAMGQGAVETYDPGKRAAGDISFVAEYVDGLWTISFECY